MTDRHLKDPVAARAFDWAIDYKPWQEDLEYREYARHGYEQGFRAATREFREALKQAGLMEKFSEFLDTLDPDGSV